MSADSPLPLDRLDPAPRPVAREVSVVIPTLGRDILELSLSAIASGTRWPARVVVVDQGDNAKVADWLALLDRHGLPTLHVRSERRGRAAAVNLGISRVETRFFAVTDDDCFAAEDWIERFAERLAARPESIVTGRVDAAEDETVAVVVQSPVERVIDRPGFIPRGASGGNLGGSTALFAKIGPFDEDPRLKTAEDCEWSYRALCRRVPIVYAPEIGVRHVGWRGEADRKTQYRSYARSHGSFYGKYLKRGDLRIAVQALVHHARALRRWARGKAAGDADLAEHGWAYLTGLVPGILSGLGKEARR